MSDFFCKITAPIAGDNPFGADVNHDPDYERLKGEMGKLGDIDVQTVETLSLKILAEKSKDIRAMAWCAYAALRANDFGRLADIFTALVCCCGSDFERVYPLRGSAKLAALRWFAESRFTGQCQKTAPTAADAPNAARLADALSKLKTLLEAKYPNDAPPLSSLCKHALAWKKTAESAASAEPSLSSDKDSGGDSGTIQNNHAADKNVSLDTRKNAGGDVVLTLSRDEYQEICRCINKLDTILKKIT